tara:strand:+ start:15786 stop:17915 length:2130 start_codon:yes stop_codon:yes gene_type:complete
MKVYGIKNLRANKVEECTPWSTKKDIPDNVIKGGKDSFVKWCMNNKTDYLHFNAYEGEIDSKRINKQNPPRRMHGIVVDYDAEVCGTTVDEIRRRCSAEAVPMYMSETFSGNARLVWLFEKPILMYNDKATHALLKLLQKEFRLTKILPGFDEKYFDVSQYYALGTKWKKIKGGEPISSSYITSLVHQSTKDIKWDTGGEVSIPIEAIAAEVESQYPGRWSDAFELGARGERFWDDTADNDTAAVVREGGMQCFTGDKGFVSWREILGNKFVSEYETDKVGKAIDGVWYDGKVYWMQSSTGRWQHWSGRDFITHLVAAQGLSKKAGEGGTASEVDRAVDMVHKLRRVDRAGPLVHQKAGIVQIGSDRMLNTSNTSLVEPDTSGSYEDTWLYQFFGTIFDEEQEAYFLSWLKRFYESARRKELTMGQAVFVAGHPHTGKSLLSNVIVSKLMGGHADCVQYLLNSSDFNSHLLDQPVWTVDDASPNSDARLHRKYEQNIKRMVAGKMHSYNKKYMEGGMVPWSGRIMVTCNLDAESIQMLPEMDVSIEDKVMLFRVSTHNMKFPDNVEDVIESELPIFAQYLLDTQVPEDILDSGNRFGIKCFHHSTLLATAKMSSGAIAFYELLMIFLDAYGEDFKGTSAELHTVMNSSEVNLPGARDYKPRQVSLALSKLSTIFPKLVFQEKRQRGDATRKWIVKRDLIESTLEVDKDF